MSNKESFLGKVVGYDIENDIITFKFQYMTPDKQELIERIVEDKAPIRFTIESLKPRFLKTYQQLREYYLNCKLILKSFQVDPTSENVKTLDMHFKMNIFEVNYIELGDEKVPHVKSKANMTIDELDLLISHQWELYSDRVDFDNKEVRKEYLK